jgi:hypothetical protein
MVSSFSCSSPAKTLPPDANTVTLPVLPATYQSYDPSDPTITIRQVVPSAVRASNYHGYVDFRRGVALRHDIGSFVYTSSVTGSSL